MCSHVTRPDGPRKEDNRAQLNRSFRLLRGKLLRNGTAMALRRFLPIAQAGNNIERGKP
jgi:hypothetical protein